jgi:hypothetical protein
MTKTNKTVLSIAILGVGGYLLWKNFKKPTPAAFAGGMGPRKKHNLGKGFAGDSSAAVATISGKRVQMSGKATDRLANKAMYANSLGGNVVDAQASGWLRGNARIIPGVGANGAPAGFFDTKSSGWVRNL